MWLRQGRASKSSGTTSQLWTDAVPRACAYRPCPRARGPPPAHVAPCAQESPCAQGWEHPQATRSHPIPLWAPRLPPQPSPPSADLGHRIPSHLSAHA